jgi:hypothetical protein
MIRTNEHQLVVSAAMVEVHPHDGPTALVVGADGTPFCLPGTGSIVYNIRVGDPAFGWMADHVEPGVTAGNPNNEQQLCLQNLTCVGNEARVASGDAKGDRGVVVGKHGAPHLVIDFPPATLEKLLIGDRIQIRMVGKGLIFYDYPAIRTLSLSPRLAGAMGLKDGPNGKLIVPVAATVPAQLMGSGLGGPTSERSDYDIMTSDTQAIAGLGLDKLRFGDLVAILDHDNRYGRTYREGAVSIGVVVHGDSRMAGHGPGVTVLFTAIEPVIEPVIDPDANLAIRLGLCEDWRQPA